MTFRQLVRAVVISRVKVSCTLDIELIAQLGRDVLVTRSHND